MPLIDIIKGLLHERSADSHDHEIYVQQAITEAVMENVRQLPATEQKQHLCLWATEASDIEVLTKEGYIPQLRLALDNEQYTQLHINNIYPYRPPVRLKPVCLQEDRLWLTVTAEPVTYHDHYYTSASLSAADDSDSITAATVLLDSAQQDRWLIDGSLPAQASITWHHGTFYIKPSPETCAPVGGVPTSIRRGTETIPLMSNALATSLHDSDIIELGPDIRLRFSASTD